VLLIEDETVLRASMARGLGKMPGLSVIEAGNLAQALAVLDTAPPDAIVSDIDLPGRSGLELIGELRRRALTTPILFVSAYLKAYRSQIPPNAQVEVLEKPVPLEQLRGWIADHVHAVAERAPFCAADYLQLACMGHHSVEIVIAGAPGGPARIRVVNGQVWSALDAQGQGVEAFKRSAFHREGPIECHALEGEPGPRDIETGTEALLIDAARELDERKRDAQAGKVPPPAAAPAKRPSSTATPAAAALPVRRPSATAVPAAGAAPAKRPGAPVLPAAAARHPTPRTTPAVAGPPPPAPAPPAPQDATQQRFGEVWDLGIAALLAKDYPGALRAFLQARDLKPDDPRVAANLKRLDDLGYHPADGGR
jgi:CheY-like chemotaxis protein